MPARGGKLVVLRRLTSAALLLVFLTLALAPVVHAMLQPPGVKGAGIKAGWSFPSLGQPAELPLEHANITADVSRVVLLNYTLLIVEDNVTLVAEGEAVISSFLYGLPLSWAEENGIELLYFSARELTEGVELEHSDELRIGDLDFWGFLISLPGAAELREGDEIKLSVEMVLNGTLSVAYRASTRDFEHRLQVPVYPCSSLKLGHVDFKAIMPPKTTVPRAEAPEGVEAKAEKEGGCWCITHEAADIEEFTATSMEITFTRANPVSFFRCPSLVREIGLTSFGKLVITDHYELLSRVDGDVRKLYLYLPAEARGVRAEDPMGELEISTRRSGGLQEVEVTLRGLVKMGELVRLKVSYELPWEEHVKRKGLSDYELRIAASEGVSWPTAHLLVKVLLPEGASPGACSPEVGYVSRGLRPVVGFSFSSFLPTDTTELVVSFSYSIFWPSFWPTLWAGLAGLVGCVLVKLITGAPAAAAPLVAISPEVAEKILEFTEAYERRMRARSELASLREALRERRISRRKFKARARVLRSEMEGLEKKVRSLLEELRGLGGRVAELLTDLEVAELELASVERERRSLEDRLARKAISLSAYRQRLRELRRDEDRAQVAIREALLRLRELVS